MTQAPNFSASISDHDPGGKVRLKLGENVHGAASFSPCGSCRFFLERWEGERHQPFVFWLGMNPSTADASVDDPTICREWGFTKRFGLNRMVKFNVSPYRATNPRDLMLHPFESEYQRNLIEGLIIASQADIVVLAHGVLPAIILHWRENWYRGLDQGGIPVRCLGTTKDGHPRHPLYLRKDTPLVEFSLNWNGKP